MPLVLSAAIALSGCQAPVPGLPSTEALPGAAPAPVTATGNAAGVAPNADGAAVEAPTESDVRSLTGVATYQSGPLAGFDVKAYDAVTGEPLPLVSNFADPGAQRYAIASINGGAGPALLNQDLVTDAQGRFQLRLRGLAEGQAVRVVITKGDVSLETLMTADEEDLDPLLTNEVDESYLAEDPEAIGLLTPDAMPPLSEQELAARTELAVFSPEELAALTTDEAVDGALIERAVERGDLDPNDPDVMSLSAATEEEVLADQALDDAEGTLAIAEDEPEAAVIAEAAEPGAAGYVLLANGLLAHRSVLATAARPIKPHKAPAPRGKLVKGPDGKQRLEVPVQKNKLPTSQETAAFTAELKAELTKLAQQLNKRLSAARARSNRAANVTQVRVNFSRYVEDLYGVRKDALAIAVVQKVRDGKPSTLDKLAAQLDAAVQDKAATKEKAIATSAGTTTAKPLSAPPKQALKATAQKTSATRKQQAAQKTQTSKTALNGMRPQSLDERKAQAAELRKQKAAKKAQLQAAGVTPKKPEIVTKPDGTTVAVVKPKTIRQVNEVTTTLSKLVSGVVKTSVMLAPKPAGVVLTQSVKDIRTLAPQLKQTLSVNPSAAGELVRASVAPAQALTSVVGLTGAKKAVTTIVTGLITQVAQLSKTPANMSPAAQSPAVLQSLKQVTLPGTPFTTGFDPAKGVVLVNAVSGQAVDASSTSAVASQVSAATSVSRASAPQPAAPSVTSLSTTAFAVGNTLTITGAHFAATAADNAVSFNGTAATPTAATATSLTVTVPAGATAGNLTVTVNGKASNATAYFIYRDGLTRAAFGTLNRFYGGLGAGIATDGSGNVYVAKPTTDAATQRGLVAVFNAAGAPLSDINPKDATDTPLLQDAGAVAIHNGFLYIADARGYQGGAGNKVVRYNLTTGAASPFIAAVGCPTGLAFDSTGHLYVASYTDSKIYKYDSNGAMVGTQFGTGLKGQPYGLAIDSTGTLYVGINAGAGDANRTVQKITAEGAVSDFYVAPAGTFEPHSIAVDAKNHVWVSMYNTNKIIRIAPDGTGTVMQSAASGCFNGIAINNDGDLFTTQNDNKVYKVTGAAPASH